MPDSFAATLRNAGPRDVEKILSFFESANDPNVLPRPAEDYRRAAANGLFYVIESGENIVAAAGVFFLSEHDVGPLEMGSCYVVPAARGFGLQRLLALPRIGAATILLDQSAAIYTAVKPDNIQSLRSVTEVGFEPLDTVNPILIEPCVSCSSRPSSGSSRMCCCDFLHLPMHRRCEAVRRLLAADTVSLTKRTTRDVLHVRMSAQLLTNSEYRAALQEFIDGEECQRVISRR